MLVLHFFAIYFFSICCCSTKVFAIHLSNEFNSNTLRASCLAFVKVRGSCAILLVHLGNHGQDALLRLDPMKTVRLTPHSHLKVAMYTKQQVAKCPKVAITTRQHESLLALRFPSTHVAEVLVVALGFASPKYLWAFLHIYVRSSYI